MSATKNNAALTILLRFAPDHARKLKVQASAYYRSVASLVRAIIGSYVTQNGHTQQTVAPRLTAKTQQFHVLLALTPEEAEYLQGDLRFKSATAHARVVILEHLEHGGGDTWQEKGGI